MRENALIPIELWGWGSKYLGRGSKVCVSLELFEGKFASPHRALGGVQIFRGGSIVSRFRTFCKI